MDLKVVPSRIRGSIAVIGSKSHTIRGITAALLAEGTSTLVAPLESADTRSTLTAACRLGATVKELPGRWEITGTGGRFTDPGSPLDLGNSGTGLRMLTSVAALQNFPIGFDGDSSLRTRLMSGLLSALEKLGAKVESRGGKCPFRISGPLHGGGTARPRGNVVPDLVGEGLVLQKGDLKQQDVGIRPFGALAQAAQFVLGQHHGHIVQRALPEGIAHDAVQPGGAVVDLLYRADRNPRGCGYTGKCIHMSLL